MYCFEGTRQGCNNKIFEIPFHSDGELTDYDHRCGSRTTIEQHAASTIAFAPINQQLTVNDRTDQISRATLLIDEVLQSTGIDDSNSSNEILGQEITECNYWFPAYSVNLYLSSQRPQQSNLEVHANRHLTKEKPKEYTSAQALNQQTSSTTTHHSSDITPINDTNEQIKNTSRRIENTQATTKRDIKA
ncbi:unnamed protein product [Didymodactylos carnosus]|uniref:Uncharacterized protein n=1 Tax=Didymodactylos carnosus TaxID=1234261 RepID=A0A815MTH3_9BILA|nr:unnamed protein product [Didymodactylos carnosus]CAF4308365.1 unnamed protein product [Didymodactylos carnosus]